MTTQLTRSTTLRATLVALALLGMSGSAHAETGVICGKPTKSGDVTMNVVVKRAGDPRATMASLG